MVHRVVVVAGMLATAACAGPVNQLSYADYNTLYTPEMFQYATLSGEMNTAVLGNPFGTGPGDPEAIARTVPTPGWFPAKRFTTQPGPNTPSNYRLVLVFNPLARGPGNDEVCRDPGTQGGGAGPGPVTVQATFCTGDRWASQVVGYGPPATGPDDPAFRSLMAQMSTVLFPPNRPSNLGDDCRGPFC